MNEESPPVKHKTLELLEFERIKRQAASYAQSEEAAELLLAGEPLYEPEPLAALKAKVGALFERLERGGAPGRHKMPSLGAILAKLAVEKSVLTPEEAFAAGTFVQQGALFINYLNQEPNPFELEAVPLCGAVSDAVFAVLKQDGSLRDLPEFTAIRKRLAALHHDVETISASFARNGETRAMLQSYAPSQRDGRVVIALKAQFRGRIKGIVREASASGQTLFIEPLEIIEKNNDLVLEERRLDAEIKRVLRELSAKLALYHADLTAFHAALLNLDTLYARAAYARAAGGVFAVSGACVELVEARHPLLGEAAVPVTISIPAGVRMVVISGANAGGKTVTLKTVGLFAAMHQFGLALPCKRAVLPVFDAVFAGIGDDQSLSAALSTFSAHLKTIAFITRNAGASSLLLLDELCSGTSVEEGAAAALAILDYLLEKKSWVLVTTHHTVLKHYAMTRHGVENASMSFDPVTLLPSYRYVRGAPGESRALDIAARSGLPSSIVASARRYLGEGFADTTRLLNSLREKELFIESEKQKLEEETRLLAAEREKLEQRELRLRQKDAVLQSADLRDVRLFLSESRKKLENLVRTITEEGANAGGINRETTRAVKSFLRELEENAAAGAREAEALAAAVEAESRRHDIPSAAGRKGGGTAKPLAAGEPRPGLAVLTGKNKRPGVIKRAGKKGAWIVEVGSVSLSFAPEELYVVEGAPPPLKPLIAAAELNSAPAACYELNVRGMRLLEALEALERQIDAAVMSGLKEFVIIHGTGTGVLQEGVHARLKQHPAVADYFFSRPELGGFGRTEVVLKHEG